MRIVSWNVNGIRAVLKKDFEQSVASLKPDILCLQETKALREQVPVDFPEYQEFWHSAERKGYSGTAIFTKIQPLSVSFGIDAAVQKKFPLVDEQDRDVSIEGRVITMEFEDYFVVTVYTPNAKNDLSRLGFRYNNWDKAFLAHCKKLETKKPVIFCGDLNVAHKEIDLARPKANEKNAGFTKEEREGFDNIVAADFIDTFRQLHPDEAERYSWWSYRGGARARNVGWRIDYVCASKSLAKKLKKADIHDDILGSDHCPVSADFDL